MKRDLRLTRSLDYKRVRRSGKSYAHPLLVLLTLPNELAHPRIGVSAGRAVGNAVARNRTKRVLRAATDALLPNIQPGNDIVLLARKAINGEKTQAVQDILVTMLKRANIYREDHD